MASTAPGPKRAVRHRPRWRWVRRGSDAHRIVFVLPRYGVGGVEKQLANLIAHRPERAAHMDVHTITFHRSASDEVEARFVAGGARNTLIDRDRYGFGPFMVRLVAAMWRLRPMVVSTMLDSSVGAWGRLAAILAGVPVLVQSDRLLKPEGTRVQFLIRPWLDRLTDRFLPNAHAIADRLEHDGVPRDRIRVMPNGVDLTTFDRDSVASERALWGIDEDAVVLGYLGRFAPLKRVDLLLEALLRLPEDARPDRVVFAGDGPTFDAVRSQAADDPWLRERCVFLGATDRTAAFLAGIDYLALPTESEGLPNVVLEAMAMAVPVVATSVSDIPRLLDGVGMLATPSDAASFSEAIAAMQWLGPEGRGALGRRARQRVEDDYAMPVAAERFWDSHLELLPPASDATR